MFRDYRNTMTDHSSHFFPCCETLYHHCSVTVCEKTGSKYKGQTRTGMRTVVWYTLSLGQEPQSFHGEASLISHRKSPLAEYYQPAQRSTDYATGAAAAADSAS